MIAYEEAKRMLDLALIDLKTIRKMVDAGEFENSVFGFHAQQAVEKTLKSWLSLRQVTYPKTHDIRVLLILLETQGEAAAKNYKHLANLTDFAVQFRYDFSESMPTLNRLSTIADIEVLIACVENLLS